MILFDALRDNPGFLLFATGLLGLLVGSFLNVVILRLPRMMEQAWKSECREILELPAVEEQKISLMLPPSCCTNCGASIRAWQNIPVISWVLLRGKCAGCKTSISMQYPLVEAATGIMSAVCAWHFGWSLDLLAALLLTWTLITLAVIDLRTQLLPDSITLPLLWLGLALALVPVSVSLQNAVVGAIAGYLSLWSMFHLFRLLTGKEGMGYGDFKLFAALGAWLGWQMLPMIILLSSLVGAAVGGAMIVFRRQGKDIPMAFGPYLAAAGWIALIWGQQITDAYLAYSGIH
ncbi:prepilin peptidase [Stenotrophobium rhamnosiphilum]|uniref:Prepilin leader peptidase/N-methyltransferase n=1 Tax=Stenotrophobium rhamnosiphilum TaxID=2029166 RepID=A0A2T5MDQ2_9GAMM|nr:A24 family peptidase [Stenotrophobium rhamnosiphilum]PTU30677.1 prepilin peptidase [Stenotrophobium rhamnosiphilum]